MRKIYPFIVFLFFFSGLFAGNIVIDGKSYTIDTVANFKAGPGTYYTAVELRGYKRLNIFFLKVDLTNPYITYRTALGRDSIYGTERPTVTASRKSKEGAVFFAGTNGDFYDTGATYNGMPTGASMTEGEVGTRPIGVPVMAFDQNKIPYIGVYTYSGKTSCKGSEYTISHANHVRNTDELVLYNKLNGKYTHTNAYGTEVLVQLQSGETWGVNKTVKANVIKIEQNKGNMAIPAGYAVLSGNGAAATYLNSFAVGDEVLITQNVNIDGANPYTEVCSADHRTMMLRAGVPTTDAIWADLHPRTAFGYSQDKKTVIQCVVDGRGISVGVGTKELAEIMLSAGAYDAVNLDGGGSSCLFLKDFGPMNRTSDGSERAVANGLYVVSSAPTDNIITEIRPYETTIQLPKYGVFRPKFLGYNQYGMLINKDVQGVVLSCPPELGSINEKGQFVASGGIDGTLTATYNGNITTTVKIHIITDAQIFMRLDSVLIDSRFEYPIEVQSVIGLNTMTVYPAALTWTIKDPSICSVTNGVLKGLKNGTTVVKGSLGSFSDSLKVKVEIPESGKLLFDSFNTSDWTFESSTVLNATISNSNLPNGWTSGAAINYVYTATRAPFLKLSRNIPLYSLPDTIKIGVNLGDITLSKTVLSLRANNAAQGIAQEFTTIPKNTDTEIVLPLNSIFKTSDIVVFPVWFEYLNFYLGTQTSGQAYTLGVKNIMLYYKGYAVTYVDTQQMSKFSIYPNPLVNRELNVKFNAIQNEKAEVSIYDISGKIVLKRSIWIENSAAKISLPNLKSGAYLLNITSEKLNESVKLMIQ